GPAGAALASGTLTPPVTPPPGGGEVVAMLTTSTVEGGAPLKVSFDASRSHATTGGTLSFAWDFGDGTTSGGGGGGPVDTSDASAVLKAASGAYGAAKRLRDAKRFEESIAAFQALASTLLPLTSN